MALYLNCKFADGEKLALEIATVQGWTDFQNWCRSMPDSEVKTFALRGKGKGSAELEKELRKVVSKHHPDPSARKVAIRLIRVLPHEGKLSVSDEPEDDELTD